MGFRWSEQDNLRCAMPLSLGPRLANYRLGVPWAFPGGYVTVRYVSTNACRLLFLIGVRSTPRVANASATVSVRASQANQHHAHAPSRHRHRTTLGSRLRDRRLPRVIGTRAANRWNVLARRVCRTTAPGARHRNPGARWPRNWLLRDGSQRVAHARCPARDVYNGRAPRG